MFSWLVLFAVFTAAQGRAVNISNAWVLPEEGFPVFYRYFRDRISWYEADAVCQFHHANLVTVDTTAQYDAVRAYLKELDISTAVWVGLIRSNPDGEFTWTDYRGLSGDGYWSSAPDSRTAPLCAAANPVADYRWEARSCGGPTVASFICELPVPQWALGNEGCMVQNIPALTILYLPESAAVQLTADCGLAEVKRVQCTGNVKHEALLKDLACVDEETTTTSLKIGTSDITTERDDTSEITTEDITTLSTSEKLISKPTSTLTTLLDNNNDATTKNTVSTENKLSKVYMNKNIHIDFINHNNIQSNDIPRIAGNDDDFIEEQLARKEDAKTKQLLVMHEELARHGNFANNDHFIPPLVMAKAKINDDMTVLSVQEKHAQQLAQQGVLNYKNTHKEIVPLESEITNLQNNKDEIKEEKLLVKKAEISNNVKKDTILKSHIPKKYNEKYISIKGKYTNPLENKNILTSQPATKTAIMESTTAVSVNEFYKITTDDNPVDLKVVFKEPVYTVEPSPRPQTESILKLVEPDDTPFPESDKINASVESLTTGYNYTDEIIKITVIKGADSPQPFTTEVFEITTKVPVFHNVDTTTTQTSGMPVTEQNISKSETAEDTTVISTSTTTTMIPITQTNNITSETHSTTPNNIAITSETPNVVTVSDNQNSTLFDINTSSDSDVSTVVEDKVITNNTILSNGTEVEMEHVTDSLDEAIDDENSPLLSGASEPLRRPPRIRRPQQQSTVKKFNPFRILG